MEKHNTGEQNFFPDTKTNDEEREAGISNTAPAPERYHNSSKDNPKYTFDLNKEVDQTICYNKFKITNDCTGQSKKKYNVPKLFGIRKKKKSKKTLHAYKEELISKTLTANQEFPENVEIRYLQTRVHDLKIRNQNRTIGKSNTKRSNVKDIRENLISRKESGSQYSDHHIVNESFVIKSLEDSITYFDLSSDLQELETSLEDVRRKKKTKEDHENCFKQIDKKIQMLSRQHHPDKINVRGASIENMTSAQIALNSTRAALKILNSAFIDDISTVHKFGFYMQLNLHALCNEDEVGRYIYEMVFKIGLLSRIQQENIISPIRNFLIESKKCMHSYLTSGGNFKKHRDLSLIYLKCCITGLQKFCTEINSVKKACKSEENNENMYLLLQNMEKDKGRMLNLLLLLEQTAEASLQGKYQFFNPMGNIDSYFVLPLVSYVNAILMCNVMLKKSSYFDFPKSDYYIVVSDSIRDDLSYMLHAFYLTSYYSGNMYHERQVLGIMGNRAFSYGLSTNKIDKEKVKEEFDKIIYQTNVYLESKFRVEDYNETNPTDRLMIYFDKYMDLLSDFEKTGQKLLKGVDEFRNKIEEIDEKFEELHNKMVEDEEQKKKVAKCLSDARKLKERISNRSQNKLYNKMVEDEEQ